MLGPGILERLADLEREAGEVEARLGDPATFEDHARYVELNRRLKELAPIVAAARAYRDAQSDLAAAREMFGEAEGEDREHLRAEIALAEGDVERLAVEIPVLLLPKDPDADRRVLLEIRGAEGGEEANLFARDLYEMYRAWAGRRGWSWEPVSTLTSELGGLTEATVLVGGEGAWSRLRHEAGPHRVQRVPVTESAGRVHTSSATVAVLPEAEEQEVAIDAGDLRVDVFRSSGAGGQHVNTTDSAVRITHLPTGLVVSVQDNRSQIQNRDRALQILRARLRQRARAEAADAEAGERRSQVGGGGRSEKVRTYNFKENRVTDHRIGLTLYSLDRVLMGELDGVSDALVADEQTRRLATGG